jgi:hypothetical protein
MKIFKNTLRFFFKRQAKISGTTLCMLKVPSTARRPYGPLQIELKFFVPFTPKDEFAIFHSKHQSR